MALFKWKIELEIMFEFPLYNLDLGSNIEMVTFFLIEQKFSRSNEIFREKRSFFYCTNEFSNRFSLKTTNNDFTEKTVLLID